MRARQQGICCFVRRPDGFAQEPKVVYFNHATNSAKCFYPGPAVKLPYFVGEEVIYPRAENPVVLGMVRPRRFFFEDSERNEELCERAMWEIEYITGLAV